MESPLIREKTIHYVSQRYWVSAKNIFSIYSKKVINERTQSTLIHLSFFY